MTTPTTIYHITTADAWHAAQSSEACCAASLQTQGFIHFSTRDQVIRVANAIYHGQQGLVLLCVNVAKLKCELRYEPPDPYIPAEHYIGELFPHGYGEVNTEAVERVVELLPVEDGSFKLPAEIQL
jgi:uncharacterized protein (DUF952 family)